MRYRLCDHLSCCRIDGALIFLDIQNDRYFKLSRALECALLAYLDNGLLAAADIDALVERRILTSAPRTETSTHPETISEPVHSALEPLPPSPRLHVAAVLDVIRIVCSTQVQLKTRRLRALLSALVIYRDRHAAVAFPTVPDSHLRASAALFRRARRYAPIETCCLLDSVSMIRFLARRGLYTNLVFGVAGDPFSAHCWVQAGDLVLNDTIGNVYAHAPIRVV